MKYRVFSLEESSIGALAKAAPGRRTPRSCRFIWDRVPVVWRTILQPSGLLRRSAPPSL
jgi:hypothetical protein